MTKPQKPQPLPYEDEVLRRMLQARPKTHEEMIGQTNGKKPASAPAKKAKK